MSLILLLQDLIKVQINEGSYNFNVLLLTQAITLLLNYHTFSVKSEHFNENNNFKWLYRKKKLFSRDSGDLTFSYNHLD